LDLDFTQHLEALVSATNKWSVLSFKTSGVHNQKQYIACRQARHSLFNLFSQSRVQCTSKCLLLLCNTKHLITSERVRVRENIFNERISTNVLNVLLEQTTR
jgi:hypothetical protein